MPRFLAAVSLAVFALSAVSTTIWADSDMKTIGALHIESPMLRATPPNAPVAAGFVTIHNTGDADDTLISAEIEGAIAGMVQLHEMKMDDGVMSMSEVAGGIALPGGEVVQLAPGGLHIMLMGLSQPLTAGEVYDVTLNFEKSGQVTIAFPVLTLGDIRAIVSEAGVMDHGNMDHSDHSGHGN